MVAATSTWCGSSREALPLNAWVHYHLGKVYLALDRPKDAQKFLQLAAELGAEAKSFSPMQDIQAILATLKDS